MKVYVVTHIEKDFGIFGDGEIISAEIVGVFKTKELASKCKNRSYVEREIEEFDLIEKEQEEN